jgi:transcriptional regulator with XRE-family HTH domain
MIDKIDSIMGLVRIGDAASLAKARQELGISLNELSKLMQISENTLNAWETKVEIPPHKNLLAWRVKIGSFLEEQIANYLGTTDPDMIHQFWDLMWRLNDLYPDPAFNPTL